MRVCVCSRVHVLACACVLAPHRAEVVGRHRAEVGSVAAPGGVVDHRGARDHGRGLVLGAARDGATRGAAAASRAHRHLI
eukprot:4106516-Pleurochrysis_carterae.AAC.1